MITGTHVLLYSKHPEADRAFFRDVLEFRSVEAGEGWLIFALPPAELGIHPSEGEFVQPHADYELLGSLLYLMCDDIDATMRSLASKKVTCSEKVEAPWGFATTVRLPSGGRIGLYQPTHPVAYKQ